jgi:hypothetical protein
MKTTRFTLAVAALLGLCPLAGQAQSSPPASAPRTALAPSAPAPAKPVPRAMSPATQRDSAAMPDETRPEGKTVPQLSIPLGKGDPTPATVGVPKSGKGRTGGGVDDSAARCKAETDDTARALCRERAAAPPAPAPMPTPAPKR